MTLESWHFADAAEWDAFVAESPQGSIFCDSRFLAATGVEFEAVALGRAGAPEAAALVILEGGEPRRAPIPYSVYQGILLAGSVAALPEHRRIARSLDLVTSLIETLTERYPRLSFCLHPAFEDVRPFTWFRYDRPEQGRFSVDVEYTAVLELDGAGGPEGPLSRARSVRRQEHRRALDTGFAVAETDEVDELLRLHRETFRRQGLDVSEQDAALVRSIAENAIGRGFGRLLVCRAPGGEAASMVLMLDDGRTAYYLFGANDPAFRPSGASTLLLFEAFRRCREAEISRVDMVGVNSPRRGDYKTSYGASLRPYFLVNWERPTSA